MLTDYSLTTERILLSFKSVQIGRQRSDQRFSFTGLHLCDTPLMKDNTANELYTERLQAQRSGIRLTADSKCFDQNVIQRFSVCQSLFELRGLRLELII